MPKRVYLILCCAVLVVLLPAASDVNAGTIGSVALLANDNTFSNALDLGAYAVGARLSISVTGTLSLDAFGFNVNPDGSLASSMLSLLPIATAWFAGAGPGYQYAYLGAGGGAGAYGSYHYPIANGLGDGVNHFSGGGLNYDLANAGVGGAGWADQGKKTTDTTDPLAIRAGAVVGTFSASPVPNSSDWFLIGYGNTITVPAGASDLRLVVVDTDATTGNNAGSFNVDLEFLPEPASIGLLFAGLLALAVTRKHRVR